MTAINPGRSPWLLPVLLNSLFLQGGIYVVRPIVSYKALELGADAILVGIIGATFALAPLVFAIYIGRFVDKGRAGLALFAGSFLLILTTIALLFINSIWLLMLAMPMLGMGHLLAMVGGQTIIANRSLDAKYERNFGLLTFYASLGHAFGPFIGGLLADSGSLADDTVNANAAFGFALVLFVLATASVFYLSSKKQNKPVLRPTEQKSSARQVLAVPTLKSAIFVAGATTAVLDVILIFLPLLGREIGLTVTEVGILLTTRAVASMAVRLVLGQMTRRMGLRGILLGGAAITLISMLGLVWAVNFWVLVAMMVIAGFAMGIGQPATMAWVSRISSPESRGLAIAIRLTANRFAQVSMPAVAGIIAGAGVGSVFYLLAASQGVAFWVTAKALKKGD
jgi:MFS family permease